MLSGVRILSKVWSCIFFHFLLLLVLDNNKEVLGFTFLSPFSSSEKSASKVLFSAQTQPSAKKFSVPVSNEDVRSFRGNHLISETTRRSVISIFPKIFVGGAAAVVVAPNAVSAAPPVAVIAEELGYFPVTNREGQTTYIPARVRRQSTEQAVELAKFMRSNGAVMYGTYWCPHCRRQKEIFGQEAWSMTKYVECAPQGINANPLLCSSKEVDGYPTWVLKNGMRISGERPLVDLAAAVRYDGIFDASAEPDLPVYSGSCR